MFGIILSREPIDLKPPFESDLQNKIAMPVEIEDAASQFIRSKRQYLRSPADHWGGAAKDEWSIDADREAVLVRDAFTTGNLGDCPIEPTGLHEARPRHAAFQHVLTIKMRPFAIARRRCMHDRGMTCTKELAEDRHSGVKCEEAVERDSRMISRQRKRYFPMQSRVVWITDRCNSG
jgi:hypothetical protein